MDSGLQSNSAAGGYATYVNALLSDYQWETSTIFYSFPDQAYHYTSGTSLGRELSYGLSNETDYFKALPVGLRPAADFALSSFWGGQAQEPFSVSGITNLNVHRTSDHSDSTHIRIAQTTAPSDANVGAWAYFPGDYSEAGDIWFRASLKNFAAGSWEWSTMIHELGHALGLSHPHNGTTIMPLDMDGMEYTVMSYRSVTGGNLSLTAETWSYSQTWMMLDIAALQTKYGADFTPNDGEVVYSWTPASGNTYVNGKVAIAPGENRIFATIWDGGGNVTYDLSAYSRGVQIDMRTGQHSTFSDVQLANVGRGEYASGNIYNGLLYNDDPRSLIKKAIGSSGNDYIVSNDADNIILSGAGNDTVILNGGDNKLWSGMGDNSITIFGNGNNVVYGDYGNDTITITGSGKNLILDGFGNDHFQFSSSSASGTIKFSIGRGDDTISGFTLSAKHVIDVSGLFSSVTQVRDALSSVGVGASLLAVAPNQTISIDVALGELLAASPSDWLLLSLDKQESLNKQDSLPVFRFFNEQTGVHFFTTSIDERNSIIVNLPQFRDEGAAFTTSAEAVDGVAIFRFFNGETGAHFYTSSEIEKGQVLETLPSFNYEGVAFHGYEHEAASRQAVYRFYNNDTGTHFYTANDNEKESVIANLPSFAFEGVSYYVDLA